jgi:urease accessory protein
VNIAGHLCAPVTGRLELVFAARPTGTALVHAHAVAPLKIVRPFALDDGRALVQILTLGPGFCAGDRHTVEIVVESGARAVVVMQAASRILGMAGGARATQTVNITVDSGGQLEYYPGLTIPFPDSSFDQRLAVAAVRDARVGLLEQWSTGRSCRGEHLRFRRLSSRTTVVVDGVPAYADAIELEPAAADVGASGILEKHHYAAAGFWHGATCEADERHPRPDALVAFGRTAPHQMFCRALAMDSVAMSTVLESVLSRINAAWHQRAIPLRRFTS